ncbi:MAG: potassium channel family protein [Candidatus Nanopelagicales bacterium]
MGPEPRSRRGFLWPQAFTDDGPYVDRFGLLLGVTALSIIGLSLFDITDPEGESNVAEIGSWAASVTVAATLLIALRASGLAARRQRIIDILVGIGLVGLTLITAVALFTDGTVVDNRYNPAGAVALLSVVIPFVVVRRLLRHERVSSATLLGAISAYLLIPLAFFHVFMAIDHWSSTPFFGQEQPSTAFMYFALVTVTTVGYGDLAAVTDVGRLAATSLAVVGQVYLVVFVAMIVGLRAQEWRSGKGGLMLPPADGLIAEVQAAEPGSDRPDPAP